MISVRGLHKSFSTVAAVRGIDMTVRGGEILVLLGQNGAGKSTTIRCMGGVLRPDAGEISYGPLRIPEDLDQIRPQLGVVTDQAHLYGRLTAPEYLDHFGRLFKVPASVRKRRIDELLSRFGLDGARSQVLWSYSKGMAQKVALIRATLHQPQWIFCDEPTAGLDPVAAVLMRDYLQEQKARGAGLVVTTHILTEAESMADRIAIMREGRLVEEGSLEVVLERRLGTRVLIAHLAAGGTMELPFGSGASPAAIGREVADLQSRLLAEGNPLWKLEEVPRSLEVVYMEAITAPAVEEAPEPSLRPPPRGAPPVLPRDLVRSLAAEPARLAHLIPFYVGSWWRRGDLSWVVYLNGFVLLLIAATSLVGSLPVGVQILARRLGGNAQTGLLLPLFFMSFALLESIKSSIGIWWEKAQGSLEVLLFAPLDDSALIWTEVLPGMVVSTVWVAAWMGAGMATLELSGRPVDWWLLGIFALVGALTAYWAAMGRILGFLLFPREGAAGGAWSFLLSPVSAAVADLPLGLFVFHSPLAPYSLLLPLGTGVALTLLTTAIFDRERLLESGLERVRPKPIRHRLAALVRHRVVLAVGFAGAGLPALIAGLLVTSRGLHSWAALRGDNAVGLAYSAAPPMPVVGGLQVAASVMSGVSGAVALALALLVLSFGAFFLLGLPQMLLLVVTGALWGAQIGFGPGAPLAGWLGLGGGIMLLALIVNTSSSLPVYTAAVIGGSGRLDRLRVAWRDYFDLYRLLVIPCCLAFGIAVALLMLHG